MLETETTDLPEQENHRGGLEMGHGIAIEPVTDVEAKEDEEDVRDLLTSRDVEIVDADTELTDPLESQQQDTVNNVPRTNKEMGKDSSDAEAESGEGIEHQEKPKLLHIFSAIRNRVIIEQALQLQLDRLAKCKLPSDLKTPLLPIRDYTTLIDWEEQGVDDSKRKKRRSHRHESKSGPQASTPRASKQDLHVREEGELGSEDGEVEEGELEPAIAPNRGSSSTSNVASSSTTVTLSTSTTNVSAPPSPTYPTVEAFRNEDTVNSAIIEDTLDDKQTNDAYNRCFRAIFRCDKEEYKAKITVSPCYPHIPPVFKLSLRRKYRDNDGYHHHQHHHHHVSAEVRANSDPEALAIALRSPSTPFSIYLKHIQTELNLNYINLIPSPNELNQLLSYQIKHLKICLDLLYEVSRRGNDSALAKIFKPHRGRDRRIAFAHSEW